MRPWGARFLVLRDNVVAAYASEADHDRGEGVLAEHDLAHCSVAASDKKKPGIAEARFCAHFLSWLAWCLVCCRVVWTCGRVDVRACGLVLRFVGRACPGRRYGVWCDSQALWQHDVM